MEFLDEIYLKPWRVRRWEDAYDMPWHRFRQRWLQSFFNHEKACWKFWILRKNDKYKF